MSSIVLGRFHNQIKFNDIESVKSRKCRVGSKKNKQIEIVKYVPIATNGSHIFYCDRLYCAHQFLKLAAKNSIKPLIVLTLKEHTLLVEKLIDYEIKVSVFELKFQIFENIKYNSDIEKNYSSLKSKLIKSNTFNILGGSLAQHFSIKHRHKVERSVRFKNRLDKYFAFAYRGGYQEVFKLKEERKSRSILALDYNSMFVSCMEGSFLKPSSIKYINTQHLEQDIKKLSNGLYRVILKHPKDTFFKAYHPFKYSIFNQSFAFSLSENDTLELLIFKNELEYYMRFFNSLEIIEGLVTNELIAHPLYSYASKLYKKRLKARKVENKTLENLYKFQLVTSHSATNPFEYKKRVFSSIEELCDFLSCEFSISKPDDLANSEFLKTFEGSKFFNISFSCRCYTLKYANFSSNEQIFSLSAQVLANARLKMVKLIEEFLEYPSLEICYINVDSIHISINKDSVPSFLEKYKNIISEKLGDLKIQVIGNKGYWFDVGRYWIGCDNNIVASANIGFNHAGSNTAFINTRKKLTHYKFGIFEFVKTYYSNILNSFSYNKMLEEGDLSRGSVNYRRFQYKDIENIFSVEKSLTKEIIESKPKKIELYNYISKKFDN